MKIEENIRIVNETYKVNFPKIIKGFRENNDIDELSYNLEEIFDESDSLGDLFDYLIENEKCQVWDIPYVTHLVLNHPEKVYTYFE